MASKDSGRTIMSPLKPAFAGSDGKPNDGKPTQYQLSQTYERGGGTVIPDPTGKIIIPGDELKGKP